MSELDIVQEAVRRSLASGALTKELSLNAAQTEALGGYADFLVSAPADIRARGYFDMATGTGKTGLFSVVTRHAYDIAREQGRSGSFKTLIVEPTVPLLGQTRAKLLSVAPELELAVGVYGGGRKDTNRPITLITYDSWLDLIESGQIKDSDISLHINDEAHHGLSARRQNILNEKLADTVHLGFTATAAYDADKTLERTHQNLIYKLGLPDAVERGMLTDYIHLQYGVMRLLPSLVKRQSVDMTGAEFTFLKRQEWARLVVRAYASEKDGVSGQPNSDKVATFFAADTRHADSLTDMLNNNPLLKRKAQLAGFEDVAVSIHTMGGWSHAEQERRLEAFQQGRYMAAVGDKKFKAGFDYPRVKFVASYPGISPVDTVQELGRATRGYIDPITGESQGTVAFEAIPYIGDADPEKDAKSRQHALANTVTAYKILGRTLVLAPGRSVTSIQPPRKGGEPRKPVILSPGCTVEMYLTDEDTLTISRQIDAAYESPANNRIEITSEMLQALRENISIRGNLGAWRLAEKIVQYEQETQKLTTGLATRALGGILAGTTRTADIEQWHRLNEVVEALPIIDRQKYIELTASMLNDLRQKITEHGGYGITRLAQQVSKHEQNNGLAPIGLTGEVLRRIVASSSVVIEISHWERLNLVIDAMPAIDVGAQIDLTTEMLDELRAKLFARGRKGTKILNGPQKISELVNQLESENDLAPIGITPGIIKSILKGEYSRVRTNQWQRLNQAIELLPLAKDIEIVRLDSNTVGELEKKILGRGDFGARRLYAAIKDYTEQYGMSLEELTELNIVRILNGKARTIEKKKWNLINKVIDSLPERSAQDLKKKDRLITPRHSDNDKSQLGTNAEPVTSQPPSTSDVSAIIEQKIAASFVGVADDLVARITEAVFARLQNQPSADSQASPPPSQPKVVRRRRQIAAPPATTTEATETVSLPEADTVSQPVGSVVEVDDKDAVRPDVINSTPAVVITPEVETPIAQAKPPEFAEQPPALDATAQPQSQSAFARFTSPHFMKADASGSTMQMLLSNAERSFGFGDTIGVRANLRKFVEMFVNSTMKAATNHYLDSLNMLPVHRNRVDTVIRDYGYTYAEVQRAEPTGRGDGKRAPRMELADLNRYFRDFVSVMTVANPERFSQKLVGHTRNIIVGASALHFQVNERESSSDAQLLQDAFQLAAWFDEQFNAKPLTVTEEFNKAEKEVDAHSNTVTEAIVPAQEPATEQIRQAESEAVVRATPSAVMGDEDEQELFSIPPTILHTLGISEAALKEELQSSRAEDYAAIAQCAARWIDEPPSIKASRNNLARILYAGVALRVNELLLTGQNVAQIVEALNASGISRDPRDNTPVPWSPYMLLRGAVLTGNSVPFEAFAKKRETSLDKPCADPVAKVAPK